MSPLAHIGMVSHNIPLILRREREREKSAQVGSIWSSLAISLERYLAVVHPFSKLRWPSQPTDESWRLITSVRSEYSSVHFILPVLAYSLLYNIPKFFELKVSCDSLTGHSGGDSNSTELELNETDSDCNYNNYKLEGRNFR